MDVTIVGAVFEFQLTTGVSEISTNPQAFYVPVHNRTGVYTLRVTGGVRKG